MASFGEEPLAGWHPARTRSRSQLDAVDHEPDAPLSSISAPALVIHGTADRMFPARAGQALADEIPDATLLILERAGRGVDRADWETIAEAVLARTAT